MDEELEVLQKIIELLDSIDNSDHERIIRTLIIWYGVIMR